MVGLGFDNRDAPVAQHRDGQTDVWPRRQRTATVPQIETPFEPGTGQLRRPDLIVYVNGLPLAVIELKNPADPDASVFSGGAGRPYLIEHADSDQEANQELVLVYEDGKLLRQISFADVRDNLRRETALLR